MPFNYNTQNYTVSKSTETPRKNTFTRSINLKKTFSANQDKEESKGFNRKHSKVLPHRSRDPMGCFDGFKLVVPNRFKHFQVTVASSSINKAPQTFNLWVDPCQKSLTYIFGSNPSLVEEVFKCNPTNFCRNFALFRNQIPSNPDLKTKNKGLQILFQKFHGEYAHKNQNTAVLTELFGRAFYGTVVIAMCTQEPNFKFHDFTPDHLEELNQGFHAYKYEEPDKSIFDDSEVSLNSIVKSSKFYSSVPTSPPRALEIDKKENEACEQAVEPQEEIKAENNCKELYKQIINILPDVYPPEEGRYSLSFLEGQQPSFLKNYDGYTLEDFCRDGFYDPVQKSCQQEVQGSSARLSSSEVRKCNNADEAPQDNQPNIKESQHFFESWCNSFEHESTSPVDSSTLETATTPNKQDW